MEERTVEGEGRRLHNALHRLGVSLKACNMMNRVCESEARRAWKSIPGMAPRPLEAEKVVKMYTLSGRIHTVTLTNHAQLARPITDYTS